MGQITAMGYIRVSTDLQAEQGVSLDAQAEKIKAMATVQSAILTEIITDGGESAKSLNRPGMEQLLSLVRRRAINTVIVTKLDRLTRSVKDLAELLECFDKHGVSLVSVAESLDTKTAAGRLVLNIMMSVSQWERETIGERTRDAMQHKKANGERVGTLPFGFRLSADSEHLEENEAEQQMLSRIQSLRTSGFTLQQIAEDLNRQGYTTRRGSPWQYQHVQSLLKALSTKNRMMNREAA
jgi:DNA invertase Pin-like site-specific DNA recombinase